MPLDAADLTQTDLAELARLHAEAMPDSLLTLLGRRYLAHAYRYFAHSAEEDLLACRRDGALAGMAVVTWSPATLVARLARHTPLAAYLLPALFRLPWRHLLGNADEDDGRPEMLVIAASKPGNGAGGELLGRVEAAVRARGAGSFTARTEDARDNRALAFYRRNGFVEEGRFLHYGRPFLRLSKAVG